MAGKPGRSGAPRKPAALRHAEGNRGKRPIPNEPKAHGVPVAPSFFNDEQRRLFGVLLAMVPQGIIAACDGPILEGFVISWWTHREARRQINALGLMVRGDSGPIRNPLLGIARGALADLNSSGAALGLSPASRARMIAPGSEEDDPMTLLLGGDDGPEWAN